MMIYFIILLYTIKGAKIENDFGDTVLYSGWLKYFYYVNGDEAECDDPGHFEINPEYGQQIAKKDLKGGYLQMARQNTYNQEVYYNMDAKLKNDQDGKDCKDNKQRFQQLDNSDIQNNKNEQPNNYQQNEGQNLLMNNIMQKLMFQDQKNQFQPDINVLKQRYQQSIQNPFTLNPLQNLNILNNFNKLNGINNPISPPIPINNFIPNLNNYNSMNGMSNMMLNNFRSNMMSNNQLSMNPNIIPNINNQAPNIQPNMYLNFQPSNPYNQYNNQQFNQQQYNNQQNNNNQQNFNNNQQSFNQQNNINQQQNNNNQQNNGSNVEEVHRFNPKFQQDNMMRNGNPLNNFVNKNGFLQFDQFRFQQPKEIQQFITEQKSIQIPNENAFFFVLTNKTLYVLSNKQLDMTHTIRSIETQWILPVTFDWNIQGGLEDVGDFTEGHCFKIKTKTMAVWTLCADTKQEKYQWMETFRLLITDYNTLYGEQKQINSLYTEPGKDGKWIIIQNFTQCSLTCGGGTQFLQRLCQPPQNGGKDCDGPTVITRPCNSQPCPKQEVLGDPVVEMKRVSDRPQRFEECELREGDLQIYNGDLNFPGRVILNNKTITIFNQAYSYDTVQKSFDLQYCIVTIPTDGNPECFFLNDSRDNSKLQKLCVLQGNIKKNQTIQQFRDGWIKDISTFRDDCQQPKINIKVEKDPEEDRLRSELQSQQNYNKMLQMQDRKLQKRELEETNSVELAVKKQQELVEKEMQYERLALQEEAMREKEEEQNLRIQIQKEKEKEDQMVRFLQQKQKKIDVIDTAKDTDNQIKLIENNTKDELIKARSQVYQKIMAMRKAADRRKLENRHQIEEIRSHIAQTVLSSERKGNQTLCDPRQPQDKRFEYCDKNIPDEKPQLKSECHGQAQDFCMSCCDNEFGLNFYEDRKNCYNDICNNAQEQSGKAGHWNWTPDSSKIAQGSSVPVPSMINQFPSSMSRNIGSGLQSLNILPPPSVSPLVKQAVDC